MIFEITYTRGGYKVVRAEVEEPKPEYFDRLNDNDKWSWIMIHATKIEPTLIKKEDWFPTDVVEVNE